MGKTCSACGQTIPTIEGLAVDNDRGEIRYDGKVVILTPHQHRVFAALADHPGRCVGKGQLADIIYFDHRGSDQPFDKIIDVFICKLRKIVTPMGLIIKTHWGRGYELLVPGLASKETDVPMDAGDVAALNYGGR